MIFRYGCINTYIIILLCGYYLASDAFKGVKQINLSGSVRIFFILFLVSYGISFIINIGYFRFGDDIFESYHIIAFFELISCLFLFTFIVSVCDSQEDIYEYLGLMVFAYLLSCVFSIVQVVYPKYGILLESFIRTQEIADNVDRGFRVYGTVGGFELFAEYSAIVLLSSCCMMLVSLDPRKKIIWLCIIFTSVIMLFMTKTRGPFVGLSICFSYLFIFHTRTFGLKNIILFLSGVVISIGLGYIAFKGSKYNIIDALLNTNIDVSGGKFDTRSKVWKYGYDYLMSMDINNQLFGVGPGIKSRTALLLNFPHNLFLYLSISLGIFGSTLYLVWFVWIGFSRQGKPLQDKSTQLTTIFFKAIIIFFIIDQLKIEYTRESNYQQIIWAYFALIYMHIHKFSVIKPKILDTETDFALAAGCFHASYRPGRNSLEKRLPIHDNT